MTKLKLSERAQAKYSILGFKLQVHGNGKITAVCLHGVAHPIPESGYKQGRDKRWSVHKCDGCCSVFLK